MSRLKPTHTSYHHGDLRNALIETGVAMLAEEGVQSLSLRKLAQRAGVSHNAPYMHFADKETLLAAIAEEGFHILTAAVESALAQNGDDWHRQLHAGCWAYVHFALAHPSHLQVMFRSYDPAICPTLYDASIGALDQLCTIIERGQAQQYVIEGDSRQIATLVWSLLHGITTILAGRKMPAVVMGRADPEELTERFVGLLLEGIGEKKRS